MFNPKKSPPPTIGVIDSGLGGRPIAAKIKAALPDATVLFLPDPDEFPYGDKPPAVIRNRLMHLTTQLLNQGATLVVVACNTATTNGIGFLRQKFPRLTFVGVEPPVKPVASLTRTGQAAILATTATIASHRFKQLLKSYSRPPALTVHGIPAPGLAELVEAEFTRKDAPTARFAQAATEKLRQLLDDPVAAGLDTLGLGCTHYSYLIPLLNALYPTLTVYDPAEAVVKRTQRLTKSLS